MDDSARVVTGVGTLTDATRRPAQDGTYAVSLDSVALFETNVLALTGPSAVMLGLTVISAGVTIACLASLPKGCFGSCPTFFVTDGREDLLQAEGFSASVSPALEATDVDALYRALPRSRDLEVRMTNDALETHVVRYVDVLAARRSPGGRVFKTPDGEFRQAAELAAPSTCVAAEGPCDDAVRAFDGVERRVGVDSTDLATRELVELSFDRVPDGDLGLVVAARQSLLTTYLFYQTLAYLGRSAGTWLAALERGGEAGRELATGVGRALGRIEVFVQDDSGDWLPVGEVGETGPIATDVWVLPLPAVSAGPLRVRLRMTRGLWRLNHVALARLGARVPPLRLSPVEVRRNGRSTAPGSGDASRTAITFPGDELRFVFRLPEDYRNYELFLETRGYYLEWMREEWLAEEDPARAAMMVMDPLRAMRELAPPFKAIEPELERAFWSSRYVRR